MFQFAIFFLLISLTPGKSADITEGCEVSNGCFFDAGNSVRVSFRNAAEQDWLDVDLLAEGQGDLYAAVGFSADRYMGQDYVVYCMSNSDAVDAYLGVNPGGRIATERLTGIQIQEYLKIESAQKVDGLLQCKLKLLKEAPTGTALAQVKFLNQSYYLFLASGQPAAPGTIRMHSAIPRPTNQKINVTDVKYAAVKAEPIPEYKIALVKSHGILMLIGWWFVMTNTILLARYAKHSIPSVKIAKKPYWMGMHMFGNWFGILLTVVAFICIFVNEEGEWGGVRAGQSLDSIAPGQYHCLFGLIASIFGFLQPIIALVRCHPGTKRRPIFNLVHRFFGIGAWIFATATLWYASSFPFFLEYRSVTHGLMIFFMAWMAISAIVLEEVSRMIETRRQAPQPTLDVIPMQQTGYRNAPKPAAPPAAQKLGFLGTVPMIIIGLCVLVSLGVVVPLAVFVGIFSPKF